MQKKAIS